MNRSLNSPSRWTIIRAAGMAVVAAAIVLPATNAEATCMVMNGTRHCSPASTINPLLIEIGGDGSGQWIAYQDTVTGSCTWDMIGNASAFYNDTSVTGTSHSDTIRTISSSVTVCGWPLSPPSPGGHGLRLTSGGGYDYLLSYLSATPVALTCSGGSQGCYFEMWGPGIVLGNELATDYVVKLGSGDWHFLTGGGSDVIHNWGSGTALTSDCGDGTLDQYDGPWDTNTSGCEVR
jgi:hypothetical protein